MYKGIGKIVLLHMICLFISLWGHSQEKNTSMAINDTTILPKKNSDTGQKLTIKDTLKTKKPKSDATKAAIKSAMIPGWGQIHNKRYWKVPIVYGALSIPVFTSSYNLKWYQKTREAYKIRYTKDTANFSKIDPQLLPLSTGSLKIYRNQFRQDMDNSVLGLLALWGLQIAEAAADAHLRGFNINDDLSLKIRPASMPLSRATGINMVLQFGNNKQHKTKGPI
ncbi:MAG: DUF5683 domain-containing protein [Chitinophagaceae bacterium]